MTDGFVWKGVNNVVVARQRRVTLFKPLHFSKTSYLEYMQVAASSARPSSIIHYL